MVVERDGEACLCPPEKLTNTLYMVWEYGATHLNNMGVLYVTFVISLLGTGVFEL